MKWHISQLWNAILHILKCIKEQLFPETYKV